MLTMRRDMIASELAAVLGQEAADPADRVGQVVRAR
jgi:hypothetical protein